MAKQPEFLITAFENTKEGRCTLVIDDRLDTSEDIVYMRKENKIKNVKTGYTWAPAVILPVSERRTRDETVELAKYIRDILNANWVKEQLGG